MQVLCYGSNDLTGKADLPLIRRGQLLIGFLRPFGSQRNRSGNRRHRCDRLLRGTDARAPRAPRAWTRFPRWRTMCGYKAVMHRRRHCCPSFFPMMTTAAGTITPARVFIIGAGVAGLQAIATARRLGAVVSAYDCAPPSRSRCRASAAASSSCPSKPKTRRTPAATPTRRTKLSIARQRELLGRSSPKATS